MKEEYDTPEKRKPGCESTDSTETGPITLTSSAKAVQSTPLYKKLMEEITCPGPDATD